MQNTQKTTPSIYVACLAAYNNGRLHGQWIEANQEAEAIQTEIQKMLSKSPIPNAEEWAIHDYEGFYGLKLSESEGIETVAEMAAMIEEHGEAWAKFAEYEGVEYATLERFEEAYADEWDSEEDFAENLASETMEIPVMLLQTLIDQLTEQYRGWEHVITGFNNYLLDHRDDILNDDDSDIVLTDVIRQRKIVYFQLPTNAYPIQAVSVAKMVQANLRYISSLIQIGQMPKDILVSVIIDEYAAFAEESFVEVLNKARSSGMMVTLAHQSLSDLKAISEPFMKRIDENTLNKIYLKQTDPELCELIAKSMGTYTKEEKTYQMAGGSFGNQIHSGNTSNRIVNEFYFPPDKIKNLYRFGQGYLIYRGDNSQKCVNLGCFKDINEVPYEPKSKENKKKGLLLFEQFYLHHRAVLTPKMTETGGVISGDEKKKKG